MTSNSENRAFTNWSVQLAFAVSLFWLAFAQVLIAVQKSYWEDEAGTADIIQGHWGNLIYADAKVHPPLYYMLAYVWSLIFGHSEIGLRSMSIICALLAALLCTTVVRQVWGITTGAIFLILLALSPLWLIYAPNARYYSLATAEIAAMALCALRFVRSGQRNWMILYAIAGAMSLYTVYLAVTAHLAIWVCMLLWWVKNRRAGTTIVPWLLANVAIALAFLPWMSVFVNALAIQTQVERTLPGMLRNIVIHVGYTLYAFTVGEAFSPLNPVTWLGMVCLFGLSIYGFINPLNRPKRLLVFGLLVGGILLAVTIMLGVGRPTNPAPNRLLFLLVTFLAWVAACINILPLRPRLLATGVMMLVSLHGQANYFQNRELLKPLLAVPWKELMAEIKQNPNPTKVAIICNEGDYACPYYVRDIGYPLIQPSEWPEIAQNNYTDVWLIFSNVTTVPPNSNENLLKSIRQRYPIESRRNLAAQDSLVINFKQRFMSGDIYKHRVNVWHFSQ